ncbi:MAG: branched-chain amino acid ABC transporter permease [Acidilobaceae archaeon]
MIDALVLAIPSIQYLLAGLAFASSIALLSAMMTLVYLVTRVPNFAQGTLVISGVLVTVYLIDRVFYTHLGSPFYLLLYLVAPVISGVFVALMAFCEYLFVIRPLRSKGIGDIGIMISTLAFDAILAGSLAIVTLVVPGVYIKKLINIDLRSLDVLLNTPLGRFYLSDLLVPLISLVLVALMHYVLYKTKFGIALRASIENPNLAKVLGINVDKTYAIAWLLAGFLSGAIGSLIGFQLSSNYGGINPTGTQYLFLISIFAGSVLGGMSSIYLSMLGGFIIGVTESIFVTTLNNVFMFGLNVNLQLHALKGLFSFLIIMIVLLAAPQGLASINWERLLGLRSKGEVVHESTGERT